MADNNNTKEKRKNPSRKECEQIIRRVLITEILQNGGNKHFRMATDFMRFFESLYPASDSLTKQVQRAVKSMDMPKDDNGFYIIDRTTEQFEQEKELTNALAKANAELVDFQGLETVFLKADDTYRHFIMNLIKNYQTLQDKYVTMVETHNGILIYTSDAKRITQILEQLLRR